MGSKIKLEKNGKSELEAEENKVGAEDAETGGDADLDLEEKLDQARNEATQSYDRFLRAAADLENFKKRAARDMEELRKYANENLLRDLLDVSDNLDRAIQSSSQGSGGDTGLIEGVDMTLKEIVKILEKNQVKAVRAVGEPFNPAFHQAFMTEKSEDYPENTVVKELQKGYTLHERLLRPAMVVVSKNQGEDALD